MIVEAPQNTSQSGIARNEAIMCAPKGPLCCSHTWYFSREEIEDHSPSRKDGIDHNAESELRKLYCSFIRELGMQLKVPQVTIASAMMLCHRFYMRQSHAKNDWKVDLLYSTACFKYLKGIDLIGERHLLSTIAFDLDIQLPYKPLVAALKSMGLYHDLLRVAWNYINDSIPTTLCLQYKPHYLAAASVFLAAKFEKVKLPMDKGKVWRLEFDISPKLLPVIHRMQEGKEGLPLPHGSNQAMGDNCITKKEELPCQTSDSGSTSSIVEDDNEENQLKMKESNLDASCTIVPVHDNRSALDVNHIREALKRRRLQRAAEKYSVETKNPE
ncbi:Cyclin family protein [Quillaja saponaria]|uniref:B-like cyclin n=1 Tax=Quillaja saponaria TaxID=32244 RepID=A0AAD7LGY6_QUISA|nr:Cyclin family protein [Quillaja saponaria]